MFKILVFLALAAVAMAADDAVPVDASTQCNAADPKAAWMKCQSDNPDQKEAANDAFKLLSGNFFAEKVCQRQEDRLTCLKSTLEAGGNCAHTDVQQALMEKIETDGSSALKGICKDGVLDTTSNAADLLSKVKTCLEKQNASKTIDAIKSELVKTVAGAEPDKTIVDTVKDVVAADVDLSISPSRKRRAVSQQDRTEVASLKASFKTSETKLFDAVKAWRGASAADKAAKKDAMDNAKADVKKKRDDVRTKMAALKSRFETATKTKIGAFATQIAEKRKKAKTMREAERKPKGKGGKPPKSKSRKGWSKEERKAELERKKAENKCKRIPRVGNAICRIARKLKGCDSFEDVKKGLLKLTELRSDKECQDKPKPCKQGKKKDNRASKERASIALVGLVHNKESDSEDLETCREAVVGKSEIWLDMDGLTVEITRAAFPKPADFTGVEPQQVSAVKVTSKDDDENAVATVTFDATNQPETFADGSATIKMNEKNAKGDIRITKKGTTGRRIKDKNSGCFIVVNWDNTDSRVVYNVLAKCPKASLDEASGMGPAGCLEPADPVEGVTVARRKKRAAEADTTNSDAENYDKQVCSGCSGVSGMSGMESEADEADADMTTTNSVTSVRAAIAVIMAAFIVTILV